MEQLQQQPPIEELTIPDDMSLPKIAKLLSEVSAGIVRLSPENMERLGIIAEARLDGWHDYMDKLESESNRLKARASMFSTAASQVANERKSMEKFLIMLMRTNAWKEMKGQDFVAKRWNGGKKVVFAPGREKPTERDWLNFPNLVSVTYSWNRAGVKDQLSSKENAELSDVAVLEDIEKFGFKVNKGVK